MFERYSQKARHVIFAARYIAGVIGSTEIETEHLLMGLLRTDKILARRFLGSPWAVEAVYREVERSKPIRTRTSSPGDMPLHVEAKRVLNLAAEEADLVSSRSICTDHILLGLLRGDKFLAGKILNELGMEVISTRDELRRVPHDDSSTEQFARETAHLTPEMLQLKERLRSIRARVEDAIAAHDFERARACSDEELTELKKLQALYHQNGLLDWLF